MKAVDYLIVGAGFYGAVMAERIANRLNRTVLLIDKRNHIGGNCYSVIDEETGIEYHTYGTHVFHTNSVDVWRYINRFTEFNGYYHQVLTTHKGRVYQMPINLETINSFYNVNLRPFEVRKFLQKEIEKENIATPRNLEEKAISLVGRRLYEAFIKGYTIKQWNKDPKDLPATIIERLPMRTNYNENYFVDARWQGIPLDGYTKIFERMLDSPNIQVLLNCDYFECRLEFKFKKSLIYTGPIDRYFDYCEGELEWRSIMINRRVEEVKDYQGIAVMNYADVEIPFTRIHEPRHLHPERNYNSGKTLLFEEIPRQAKGLDFYYPVADENNENILKRYKSLASKEKNVHIGGRQGDYAYYDMDKTILAALTKFANGICKNDY